MDHDNLMAYIRWCVQWSKTDDAAWLKTGLNVYLVFDVKKALLLSKFRTINQHSDIDFQTLEGWKKYYASKGKTLPSS